MRRRKPFDQRGWWSARTRVAGWVPQTWKNIKEGRIPAVLLAVMRDAARPMRPPELASAMLLRDPEVFQPWREDEPSASVGLILADRNYMGSRFSEYIAQLRKFGVPILTTNTGYAINWAHLNAEAITSRAMAIAMREHAVMVSFELRSSNSAITMRVPKDKRAVPHELCSDDVRDIIDWFDERTDKLKEFGRMNFHGAISVDGNDVAVASLKHMAGISITLHVGLKSIHEHDIYLADRARLLSEFHSRQGDAFDERTQAFREELLDYFADHNDLSGFSLDDFARTHGIEFSPLAPLGLRYDRSVDLETLARLKDTKDGYTSPKYYATREAVLLEKAIELRSKEQPDTEQAIAAEALIYELQERSTRDQQWMAEQQRLSARIEQDPFDEPNFKRLINNLAELAWQLSGYRRASDLLTAFDIFTQAASMIPSLEPIDAKRSFDECISALMVANSDSPFSRIIVGKLLDHAENAWLDSRQTTRQNAVDECVGVLREAYRVIKYEIFCPRVEPISENESDSTQYPMSRSCDQMNGPLSVSDGEIVKVTFRSDYGECSVSGRVRTIGEEVEVTSLWSLTKYVHQIRMGEILNVESMASEARHVDAAGYARVDDAWNRFAAIVDAAHACEEVSVHKTGRDDEVRIVCPMRYEGVLEFWKGPGLRGSVVWWTGHTSTMLCNLSLEEAVKAVLGSDNRA